MGYVDLHCHSTASDGTLAPADVVRAAQESNVTALSLTDHDTVAGVADAASVAASLGIEFLPGIEISCRYPKPGTLHLLGYGVDPGSAALGELTRKLIRGRDERNVRIVAALQEQNVAITVEEVENVAGGDVIGRPHIAQVLVSKGYVNSIKQAFNKYLAPGGSAYFDKEVFSPADAIQTVLDAGGVPVLAHPVQLRCENSAQLATVVKNLVDLGLQGIEVIHSDHSPQDIDQMTDLARRYHLLKTGGSDFHGGNKPGIALGSANGRRVPREWFETLRARVKR